MRKLIATIALLGLALPASAADCATGTINWWGTSPILTSRTDGDGIRFAIVGQFVNYTVDDGALASTQVPHDAEGVTVCADGVTFALAEEPVEREPVPTVADVDAETWETFEDEGGDTTQYKSAGVYPI